MWFAIPIAVFAFAIGFTAGKHRISRHSSDPELSAYSRHWFLAAWVLLIALGVTALIGSQLSDEFLEAMDYKSNRPSAEATAWGLAIVACALLYLGGFSCASWWAWRTSPTRR